VLVGNADMMATSVAPVPVPVAPAPAPAELAARPTAAASAPQPSLATPPQPAASSTARPLATLRDLLAGADARLAVQLQAQPAQLRVKRDTFRLTVTSARDAYLYVLYVGSDQRDFQLIYPTRASEPNRLAADVPFEIPRRWRSLGPAGTNHVLAIASPTERDFSALFTDGAAKATVANAARLHEAMCQQALGGAGCAAAPGGDASGAAGARSAIYGAALLPVLEFE